MSPPTMSVAAVTGLLAFAACAVTRSRRAPPRTPNTSSARSSLMSWSSTSSRRLLMRRQRPITMALVREEHTHSHSHGTKDNGNQKNTPESGHAHSHSHGGHSHSHSHGDHAHSHGDATPSEIIGDASPESNQQWLRLSSDSEATSKPYAFTRNPQLTRAAGEGKTLFIDAYTAGVAGDMFVAAMLDLGVPVDVINDELRKLKNFSGFQLDVTHREKSCIVAPGFKVLETEPQPLRDYAEIKDMLINSALTPGVKEKALSAFKLLAKGEAEVHGMPLNEVHFHEVGAVDSIVDIVAVCACVEYLQFHSIEVSPLPMGRGIIKGAAHGLLPSPPPAVVSCLCASGLETYDAAMDGELVTPTGACLVASLCTGGGSTRWPDRFQMDRVAYGAGTKEWNDRPNLLRVVMGEVAG